MARAAVLTYSICVSMSVRNLIAHFIIQDESYYGVDWDGPIPTSDESTVQVDNLPSVLTSDQQDYLRSQIPPYTNLTDEWMIDSFTLAKVYIHNTCT